MKVRSSCDGWPRTAGPARSARKPPPVPPPDQAGHAQGRRQPCHGSATRYAHEHPSSGGTLEGEHAGWTPPGGPRRGRVPDPGSGQHRGRGDRRLVTTAADSARPRSVAASSSRIAAYLALIDSSEESRNPRPVVALDRHEAGDAVAALDRPKPLGQHIRRGRVAPDPVNLDEHLLDVARSSIASLLLAGIRSVSPWRHEETVVRSRAAGLDHLACPEVTSPTRTALRVAPRGRPTRGNEGRADNARRPQSASPLLRPARRRALSYPRSRRSSFARDPPPIRVRLPASGAIGSLETIGASRVATTQSAPASALRDVASRSALRTRTRPSTRRMATTTSSAQPRR